VCTRLTQLGRARFKLDQNIHRLQDREMLVTSCCVAASVSADKLMPVRMPAGLRAALPEGKE
jgi:acyl-CoA thioesterase FadM